jgi:DNA-binding response OmpR family regulator
MAEPGDTVTATGHSTAVDAAADPAWPGRGPARVLLVLDHEVLAGVVELALAHVHGRFRARVAPDAAAAAAVLGEWRPHLAVVDMDLARGEMLARLGYTAPPSAARVPVVALTRRGDLKAKLEAFERGVDDLLSVPFSPEELVARVLAVLRRTSRDGVALRPVLRLGELEIDILNRRVRAGTSELHLTSLELSLLYLLAANAGRLLSRDEILDHLWGVDYAAESNVVDRHVRDLRAKLQDDWRRPRYIATVPGRGYRFLPTDTAADEGPAAPVAGARPATSSRPAPAPAPASAALRATARSQPSAGTRRV